MSRYHHVHVEGILFGGSLYSLEGVHPFISLISKSGITHKTYIIPSENV